MKITKIIGREIYDSRGWPTVECELLLEDGSYVAASVPSGLSRGSQEVCELRDGGTRLQGKGVQQAIENIENLIAPVLLAQIPDVVAMDLAMIELDGTPDRSKLGGNAMLAVSMAVLRAQAVASDMEPYELIAYLCDYSSVTLPIPLFNIINGGVHADNNLRIQEFMIVPVGSQSFRACMEAAVSLFHTLELAVKKKGFKLVYGDEGGLACNFKDDEQALDLLHETIQKVTKATGQQFLISLDVASSQFYSQKKRTYQWHDKSLSTEKMIDMYKGFVKDYPIFSIEDGLSEWDVEGWIAMTEALGDKIQIVGDDIFVSSPNRIARAIENGIGTSAIVKPNQVGTVTESLQAIKLCREHDMGVIVSHRSGETNDTFIVDLVVGTSGGYIKAGGVTRGERLAKYNELLRIEDVLMLTLLG